MHINRSTTNTVSICFVECKHIFLHKGRKQSIQEKGGEYWMLTIETIYKNIAQGKMLRS